jgi:hypothetical protein
VWDVWNLLSASYFKYVVSVTTTAVDEIQRSNSIGPNSIYAAHLEQQVLFRFIYLDPSNPEVLPDRYLSLHINIQSAWEQLFPGGSFERFGKLGHAPPEVSHSSNFINASSQEHHDVSPFFSSGLFLSGIAAIETSLFQACARFPPRNAAQYLLLEFLFDFSERVARWIAAHFLILPLFGHFVGPIAERQLSARQQNPVKKFAK